MPINEGLTSRLHCGMKNVQNGFIIYVTDHTFAFLYVQKISQEEKVSGWETLLYNLSISMMIMLTY